MQTLFISDIHLSEKHPILLENFLDFINNINPDRTEALYILGDFFDAWIGDDSISFNACNAWINNIICVLNNLSRKNIQIYIMQGNRDFLIGQEFALVCGAKLLPDPSVIDLYGVRTLLSHGDIFCTNDKNYQLFRKFRSLEFIKNLFLKLPINIRQKLAAYIRHKSLQDHPKKTAAIMDVSDKTIKKILAAYQVKQLIHGHTHQAFRHDMNDYIRYVLPDWHPKGGVLIARPDNAPELQIWD